MSKLESKTGKVKKSDEVIFNFLTDFTNIEKLITPGKVKNWQATKESCRFTVEGAGDFGMKILEKTPNSLIKIVSDGSNPVNFIFWIQLKKLEENLTAVRVVLEPEMGGMMLMVIKSSIQKFLDLLIDQVENLKFEQA